MIILRKRQLIIFTVVVSVMFLVIAAFAYREVSELTRAGESARLLAEKILFVGLFAVLITVLMVFLILRRATSLEHRLDRLIDQGKHKDIVPGRDFVGMGPLGDKLTSLFNMLSQLNYQKARKISGMQSLVIFLIRNQDIPVIITDITGVIRYVSDVLLEKWELKRQDVIGENVAEIAKGLALTPLVMKITRSREPIEDKAGDISFTCYPLLDRVDEVAYMAFMIGTKAGYFDKRVEKKDNRGRRAGSLLAGLDKLRSGFRKS